MKRSFSLPRSHVVAVEDSALSREVTRHTESEAATESILRSLERLGSDDSIRHYEIAPARSQRTYRETVPVVWTVRAVRD